MSNNNSSIEDKQTETADNTITFRVTSKDTLKLDFITELLTDCNQIEKDNTSETLRWTIDFVFNLLNRIASQKASGNISNSLVIDLSFLKLQ